MESLSPSFSSILPGLELSSIVSIIASLALVSIRIGSFFLVSPLFGWRIIPIQVRIIVSFAISFLIYDKVIIPDINDLVGFKLVITILVLSLTILPFHLLGLNALIGDIDNFFE